MESLLKPYLKKQILLEADEIKAQTRELREMQTTLVWDVINDKSFANKLSHLVRLDQEKFVEQVRRGNIPKSEHLSKIQVKKLIQAGPESGPHTAWVGWKAGTYPPNPGNTRVEKGQFFGTNDRIEWGKAPVATDLASGEPIPDFKLTPATMGDVYTNLTWSQEIASLWADAKGKAKKEKTKVAQPTSQTTDQIAQAVKDAEKELDEPKDVGTKTTEPPKTDTSDKPHPGAIPGVKFSPTGAMIRGTSDTVKGTQTDEPPDREIETPDPIVAVRGGGGGTGDTTYDWKNWDDRLARAQQIGNWSTGSESQQKALTRNIKELLDIFGNEDFITGEEASKIKDEMEVNDPKKVFIMLGEFDTKWWKSSKYAMQLMSRDLLQAYLDNPKENKLYFNKNEDDQYFWEDEPSVTGGQTKQTIGKKGGLFSDDKDAMKYIPALLSYASAYPEKVKDFIIKQGAEMTPSKTITLGDTKVPGAIFMDGNYVNQIWKHWATELGGTKETLPSWDNETKKWRQNKTGKTSADQQDIKQARRQNGTLDPSKLKELYAENETYAQTIMLLGFMAALGPMAAGFASSLAAGSTSVGLTAKGIFGTGLGALGLKYGSLSQEQKVELAMSSTNFGYAMLEDIGRQVPGYRNAFKSALPFDISNLFKSVMENKPNLTAGQLADFRRTLRVPGTLMKIGGAGPQKVSVENIQQKPSFRKLIDITNILNEEPVSNMKTASELNQVSPYQIQNANAMLNAMGMSSGWRFVQPRENVEIPSDGLKLANTSVNTHRSITPEGMVEINVTQRSFGDDPNDEVNTEKVVKLAPVPVEDIEGQPNSALYLAELIVQAQSDIVDRTGGATMKPAVLLDTVQKKVVELSIDLSLSSDGTPVDPNTKFNAGKAVEAIFKDEDGPVYEFINNPEVQAKETLSQPAENLPDVEVAEESVEPIPVNPSEEEGEKEDEKEDKGSKTDEPEPDEGGDEEEDLGDGPGDGDGNDAEGTTFDDNLGGEDDDDEPTGVAKLTPEQITAIKTRLSDKKFGAGSRDPKIPWGLELQQIFKIGPNGTKTDFIDKFNKVRAVVTNSTSPTPPETDLNDVGASVIPAGTRIKAYDDALKSGPGAEIIKQITDQDPAFTKVWDRRKIKTFALAKNAAIFYYFGTAIQVATNKEQFVALQGQEKTSLTKEPPTQTQPPVGNALEGKIQELLGAEQYALWQKFAGDLSDEEKGCVIHMMHSAQKKLVASGGGNTVPRRPGPRSPGRNQWIQKYGKTHNPDGSVKESIETTGTILQENFMSAIMKGGLKTAIKTFVKPIIDDIVKAGVGGNIGSIAKNGRYSNTLDIISRTMGGGATREQAVMFLRQAGKSGQMKSWTKLSDIHGASRAFMKTQVKAAEKLAIKKAKIKAATAASKATTLSKVKVLGKDGAVKLGQAIKNNPKKFAAGAVGAGALALWLNKGANNCDKDSLLAKMSAKGVGLG